MKKLIDKYGWHLTAILIALVAALVVVFGFGEALGIDPAFREELSRWLGLAWAAAMTTIVPPLVKYAKEWLTRDTDKDGTPDFLDSDANGNGKPDGTTNPPSAPMPGLADELEPEVNP